MFCKKCGFTLDDDAVFCSKCGTQTNLDSHNKTQEAGGLNINQNQPIESPYISHSESPANISPQNNFTNWQQQNPNQFNNFPQRPSAPKKSTQTIIIISIVSILVLAGLIFGAYMLFLRDKPSDPAPANIKNVPANKSIKDVILGTWDGYEAGEKTSEVTLKFEKNGECSIIENGDTSTGKYTIDDSDKFNIRIEIISDDGWDSAFYVNKVNNDKLEFTDEDDIRKEDIITFIRKK